jgi:hypothetical protein
MVDRLINSVFFEGRMVAMFLGILCGHFSTIGSGPLDTPRGLGCTSSTTRITSRDTPRTQSSDSRISWHPIDPKLIANA